MFDIGFWELLVIAVVLLLVMGPERLPEVARQAAFLIRKARQSMYRLRNEMQGEIDGTPFADLRAAQQEMRDFKNDMRQFGSELADSAQSSNAAKRGQPAPVRGVPSQAVPQAESTKTESTKTASSSPSTPSAGLQVTPKVTKRATKRVTQKAAPKTADAASADTTQKPVRKVAKKSSKKTSKKVAKRNTAKPD